MLANFVSIGCLLFVVYSGEQALEVPNLPFGDMPDVWAPYQSL